MAYEIQINMVGHKSSLLCCTAFVKTHPIESVLSQCLPTKKMCATHRIYL